jgi:signal transduction histidine kinase
LKVKASPGARSWIVAGVRHELLTRALPALRHDMAAPLSVIRMSLLLLKHRAAAASPDEGASEEPLEAISQQVDALADGVRSLRDWELVASDDGITRSTLVQRCASLMRAAFELHGIGLHVDEDLIAGTPDEPRFPEGAALRYMVLGALGYLHDTTERLGALHIEADGPEGLRFVATHGDSALADSMPPMAGALRAPRKLAIDAVALQALADGLGYAVAVEGETVRLTLRSS